MAFRRDRNIRDVYEDRFPPERMQGLFLRGAQGERRPPFNRPEEEYGRNFEYDGPRFYPNGGRNYHGEDQRSFHADGHHSFQNEHRAGPSGRRDDFPFYRGPRDDNHGPRQMDFRPGNRAASGPNTQRQSSYPAPRTLSAIGPDAGDDTLMQAILSLDRGEDRDNLRRKATFPQVRERSPSRRDVPPSPHSRSGSSISSRSYSPERSRTLPFPAQQGKRFEEPYGSGRAPDRERAAGPAVSASQDGSPHSSASATKDDSVMAEVPPEEVLPTAEEAPPPVTDHFQERRAQAISAKAQEIEKIYRQDCETFGMVVKMLLAKEPSLEKTLQNPLKENLIEIRDRCLEDLKNFIAEYDESGRQPEAAV